MSYINDALERAQKSKDSLYRQYEKVISAPDHRQTNVGMKTKWIIRTGVFVAILLALSVFSLLGHNIILDKTGTKAIEHESFKNEKNQTLSQEAPAAPEPRADEAPPVKSQDVKDMYKDALTHQQKNNLIEAERLYNKILKSNPNFVLVMNNLGVIYMSQKRDEEAINMFSKAIGLEADYVDPYYNLACLYSHLNNIPKSLEYLSVAISINRDVKNWAESDKDLKNVRLSDAYKKMMEQ